jgi:hypothetical protein
VNAAPGDENLGSGPPASRLARSLAVHGFMTLWHGEPRAITELTTDLPMAQALSAAGRIELDDDGVLVGVHGLVARATAHRIEHAGGIVHTWCALDAIGIPAALRLDAIAVTACPCCGVELRVSLQDGDPSAKPDVRLWLPGGRCSHLVEDFCRHANLYCNSTHLASVVPPDQPGEAIEVVAAAAIGRITWSDVAAIRDDLLEKGS